MGNTFINIGRQLVDGHWVLSFPNPEQAVLAKQMVQQHAANLRQLYTEALAQLLQP